MSTEPFSHIAYLFGFYFLPAGVPLQPEKVHLLKVKENPQNAITA